MDRAFIKIGKTRIFLGMRIVKEEVIKKYNQNKSKYNELNLNNDFTNDDEKLQSVHLICRKIKYLNYPTIIINIQFYKHLKDISYNIQVSGFVDETLSYVIEEINIGGSI